MKLKYYMRGLGIGIILTTLTFTIVKTDEKLSDEEIIKRAEELGMIMKDDQDSSLEQLLNGKKTSNTTDEITKLPEEPSLTPTETPEEVITPTITLTPTPELTPQATITPTAIPEPTVQGEEISFTIKRGMTSVEVARLLKDVGIIEDDKAFNQYIVSKRKQSNIRTGNFSLPKNAGYDDIIDAITKRKEGSTN